MTARPPPPQPFEHVRAGIAVTCDALGELRSGARSIAGGTMGSDRESLVMVERVLTVAHAFMKSDLEFAGEVDIRFGSSGSPEGLLGARRACDALGLLAASLRAALIDPSFGAAIGERGGVERVLSNVDVTLAEAERAFRCLAAELSAHGPVPEP
jgi:hypothetical protein